MIIVSVYYSKLFLQIHNLPELEGNEGCCYCNRVNPTNKLLFWTVDFKFFVSYLNQRIRMEGSCQNPLKNDIRVLRLIYLSSKYEMEASFENGFSLFIRCLFWKV